MATLSIIPVEDTSSVCPLYARYGGQYQPQPAFIWLNCDEGTMGADYSGEIGNAVPSTVWHNRELRWSVDCNLNLAAIERRLEYIAPLAQRILDGYECDWDGNNWVGTFTKDAKAAIEEIDRWLEDQGFDPDEVGNIVSCSEWFQYDSLRHLWPEGVTLEDAARELRENPGDNVELTDDPEDYLLERAEHAFDPYRRSHDDAPNGGLHELQIKALLEAGLIDEDDIESEEDAEEDD